MLGERLSLWCGWNDDDDEDDDDDDEEEEEVSDEKEGRKEPIDDEDVDGIEKKFEESS